MNLKKPLALLCAIAIIFAMPIYAAPSQPLPELDINAKGAIIGELTNDTILYEKSADERLFPASTTKLMTALVAIEHLKEDEIVTVAESHVEGLVEQGSNVFLIAGEQLNAMDMLRYLVIPSGNDAANALADHISGSTSEFVKLMNEKATELGCTNTNFTNPNGLHDENHYTSARDLYIIAKAAMKNPVLREMVAMPQFKLPPTNMHPEETTITSTNLLLSRIKDARYYTKDAFGIKTGTTTPAGFCLIGGFESGDLQYVTVVLGGSKDKETGDIGAYTETIKMFNYAKANFTSQTLVTKGAPIKDVAVRFSSGNDNLVLVPNKDFIKLTQKNVDISKVTFYTSIQEPLDAPIAKGDILGSATVEIDGKTYGDIELVAATAVERSTFKFILHGISSFFKSTAFKIILAALLALIILLVFVKATNKRKRRRSRYRRK